MTRNVFGGSYHTYEMANVCFLQIQCFQSTLRIFCRGQVIDCLSPAVNPIEYPKMTAFTNWSQNCIFKVKIVSRFPDFLFLPFSLFPFLLVCLKAIVFCGNLSLCPGELLPLAVFLKESTDSGLETISSLTQWPWEHKASDKSRAYVAIQFLSGGIILKSKRQ